MSGDTISNAEIDAIYAELDAEMPEIRRTVNRMVNRLYKLGPLSQKQALCMLTAGWIRGTYPDDDKAAFALSEAVREQVNLYLATKEGGIN